MQKRLEVTAITVTIPLHAELRRGTMASMIRQSELPRTLSEVEDQQ